MLVVQILQHDVEDGLRLTGGWLASITQLECDRIVECCYNQNIVFALLQRRTGNEGEIVMDIRATKEKGKRSQGVIMNLLSTFYFIFIITETI